MSARARQVVAVSFAAALLVVSVARSRPAERFEPFPGDVTVAVSPTPNIYADQPDVRIEQLVSSMNAMWARAFDAAGDEYEPPGIEARSGIAQEGCAHGATETWSGVYCPPDREVVMDVAEMIELRRRYGDETSDVLLGHVLAHEIGHHVQELRGAPDTPDAIQRRELHANCLAGVWAKAGGRPLPPEWSYTGDAEHGTAEQQRAWVERGHASGRPAACDAIWTG